MAIGFPGSPFNKKQFSVDSKLYEYNSTLGAWSKGVRAPVSPGTATITDISNLVDGSNLLNNPGSTIPSYATEVEVLSQSVGVQDGQMAYAEDTDKLYVFSGYSWYKTSTAIEYVPPAPFGWGGARGVILGGRPSAGGQVSDVDYFTVGLTGTTTNFGNLIQVKSLCSSISNVTYAVTAGGETGTGTVVDLNEIDYLTIALGGTAQDFGDLTSANRNMASISNGTIGLFAGGFPTRNFMNSITVGTPSQATSFGTLNENRNAGMGGVNDSTTALFGGGADNFNVAQTTVMATTIATTGTTNTVGDLSAARTWIASTSDNTRGVWAGGYSMNTGNTWVSTIDYMTIANPESTAVTLGSLFNTRKQSAGKACSDGTYAVVAGGYNNAPLDTMDVFTIQTTASATDFGNLRQALAYMGVTAGSPS